MRSQTIPRAIAAAAAIVVAGLVLLLGRDPSDEPPLVILPTQSSPPAQSEAPIVRAAAEQTVPLDDERAAKVRELEAMSETFRNTTFLIAIRDSGFVCNELLRVYGGIDTSAKWIATCSEMHAYTVSVAGTGTLRVAPMLQYFDGLAPRINGQDLEPSSVPEPRREPRSLPPQQR